MILNKNIPFTFNGEAIDVLADPTARFPDVLRNELRYTGTKEGCGIGECGACTIVVDNEAVNSCLLFMGQVEGKDVLTVEGLSEEEIGRTLQTCFIEENAVQCGFCTPGMLMSAYALLKTNPAPSREEIRLAISGNLCRCTGYVPIINAIQKAEQELNSNVDDDQKQEAIS